MLRVSAVGLITAGGRSKRVITAIYAEAPA